MSVETVGGTVVLHLPAEGRPIASEQDASTSSGRCATSSASPTAGTTCGSSPAAPSSRLASG